MLRFAALIILVGFPVLESVLLIRAASEIGWWLLAYLVGAAALGIGMIRREHAAWPARFLTATPFAALFTTGRRLVAGILLILPGFISDAFALVLLIWPARREPPVRPDHGVIEGEFRRED